MRTALQFAMESPEMLSSIRVFEQVGIDGHNAKLNDASLASGDKTFKKMHETHQMLLSYEDEDLNQMEKM